MPATTATVSAAGVRGAGMGRGRTGVSRSAGMSVSRVATGVTVTMVRVSRFAGISIKRDRIAAAATRLAGFLRRLFSFPEEKHGTVTVA